MFSYTSNIHLCVLWKVACLFGFVQLVFATMSEDMTSSAPKIGQTTTINPLTMNSLKKFHRRNQQTDPCDPLLSEVNSCVLIADPTCGVCVTTAFDTFLTTISTNFTCVDFEDGVCPIIYQDCLCTPCNTQLESYFSCVLNDVSNDACPTAYCDPLKDFSVTPAACVDQLAFASACIGSECLTCLGEKIDTGAQCIDYQQMMCDALNIDCLSCLACRNAIEPWLLCIAVESKSCDTFECQASMSPSDVPSDIGGPTDDITTSPTLTPQLSIIGTTTLPTNDVPSLATNPAITSPNIASTPVTIPNDTTRDTSSVRIATYINVQLTIFIGITFILYLV
jgi:hypothetical protein